MEWEKMEYVCGSGQMNRSKIPTGWIVIYHSHKSSSITFVYDPEHLWIREGAKLKKYIRNKITNERRLV